MAVLPDPFSIFPKGVWARDYDFARSSEMRDAEKPCTGVTTGELTNSCPIYGF